MFGGIIEWFADIGSLAGFLTFVVTILGAISLFIANIGRYFQAKRFGIPINAVAQANISDSVDLWIALVGALGLGVFAPFAMLNAGLAWAWWQLLSAAFAVFSLGLLSTKSYSGIGHEKKMMRDGNEYVVVKDITLFVLLGVALAAAFAYLRLHYVYGGPPMADGGGQNGFFAAFLTVAAIIAQGIYALVLLLLLLNHMYIRLSGHGDAMTAVIDGAAYLIAMRHNQSQWILLRCDIEERAGEGKRANVPERNILFTKGAFIIRDLSALGEPIAYRKGFVVVDKGSRAQSSAPFG